VAASSTHVATPFIDLSRSSIEGKLGASRMFLSSGSTPYGNADPAAVSAIPASFARAMTRFAVPSTTSRLMKYPPFGSVHDATFDAPRRSSRIFRTSANFGARISRCFSMWARTPSASPKNRR
jgi:hypothetical protein